MKSSWKIIKWKNRPDEVAPIELSCPKCGKEAELFVDPIVVSHTIAAMALRLVFDPPGFRPPKNAMPDEIQCRKCRRIFGD